MNNQLKVLQASAQVRHLNSKGGLGDAVLGLAQELQRRGDVETRLVTADHKPASDLVRVGPNLTLAMGDKTVTADVFLKSLPNTTGPNSVICYIIRLPPSIKLNSSDHGVFLSRAVVELTELLHHTSPSYRFEADLVHCHDWQTGLVPLYLELAATGKSIPTIFTSHNMQSGYQGRFDLRETAHLAGLTDPGLFRDGVTGSVVHFGQFNFTKAALGHADLINTVSPVYAKETVNFPAFSGMLNGLLFERRRDYQGVLNGIDTEEEWNPEEDSYLPADCRYGVGDPPETILARKRALRKWLKDFPEFAGVSNDSFLAAFIGRLSDQKAQIFCEPLDHLLRTQGLQISVLAEPDRDDTVWVAKAAQLKQIAQEPGSRLMVCDRYDLALSHILYAAADAIFMPSKYEPCGLVQQIGLRYGTVPIGVRHTGGLVDTVVNEAAGIEATGFAFKEPTGFEDLVDLPVAADLLVANVERAYRCWQTDRGRWVQLMLNGMRKDSSWRTPAEQYVEIYREAIRRHSRRCSLALR